MKYYFEDEVFYISLDCGSFFYSYLLQIRTWGPGSILVKACGREVVVRSGSVVSPGSPVSSTTPTSAPTSAPSRTRI